MSIDDREWTPFELPEEPITVLEDPQPPRFFTVPRGYKPSPPHCVLCEFGVPKKQHPQRTRRA